MTRYVVLLMLLGLPVAAAPPERALSFTRLWTHSHVTPGQLSEMLVANEGTPNATA
jgi:hypothetical protein